MGWVAVCKGGFVLDLGLPQSRLRTLTGRPGVLRFMGLGGRLETLVSLAFCRGP